MRDAACRAGGVCGRSRSPRSAISAKLRPCAVSASRPPLTGSAESACAASRSRNPLARGSRTVFIGRLRQGVTRPERCRRHGLRHHRIRHRFRTQVPAEARSPADRRFDGRAWPPADPQKARTERSPQQQWRGVPGEEHAVKLDRPIGCGHRLLSFFGAGEAPPLRSRG